MTKILIPATSPEDWKRLLADPEKQWKRGYSARTLAHSWQAAGGMPHEVIVILSTLAPLKNLHAIFVIPEYRVPLPGGARPSQNDIWVLGKSDTGLVSIAVEGKVSEPFGPTIDEWFKSKTPGKEKRLKYLCNILNLHYPPPSSARYQLFHRTASAIIEAKRFGIKEAVMVIHSFSPTNEWFEDYNFFLSLFDLTGGINSACRTNITKGMHLNFAWVHGNEKFLKF